MNKNEYNGWTNYETWNVALWLDNDQGTQEICREMAQHSKTIGELSQMLKDFVEEFTPDLGASMFADLLGAALSEVDWYEIAEHYSEDMEQDEEQA